MVPDQLTFRIAPGRLTVEAQGFDPVTLPWSLARDGSGFHLYAYTLGGDDLAKMMRLTSVNLSRRPALTPAVANDPAPGVAPLPMATLCDATPSPLWEPIGYAGGNFEAFAAYSGQGLKINLPAGNSWAATGLLSAAPILTLDPAATAVPLPGSSLISTRIQAQASCWHCRLPGFRTCGLTTLGGS